MKYLLCYATLAAVLTVTSVQAKTLNEYASEGQWQQAERILQREQRVCHRAENPKACELKVDFSKAWLLAQQAQTEPDQRTKLRLLGLARNGYLAILQSRPGHTATVDNLILVLEQLGDRNELIKRLDSITEPKRIAEVAEIIGNLSLAANDSVVAFDYYWKAYDQAKNNRILNSCLKAFEVQPQARQAKLLLKWAGSKQDIPAELRDRLYSSIARQHIANAPKAAEKAALAWVTSRGSDRTLTADIVSKTFDIERDPVFKELYSRLNSEYLGATEQQARLTRQIMATGKSDGWWSQSIERSQALALAGWSAGQNYLLEQKPGAAKKVWQGALYYAPASENYMSTLKGQPAVVLDLLTDLARLQQLYKKTLDPQGRGFKTIEGLLFNSKRVAYEVNDLEAILRHHTLLGKLYADLGIFENDVRGAKFQLNNAIKTADRLAKQGATLNPQPALANLLADGYNCSLPKQNKASCTENTSMAVTWYKRAAFDYLDLDAVERADKSLQSIHKINPVFTQQELQLQAIIRTRSNLSVDVNDPDAKWLEQTDSSLPKEFVERQQFKVYAEAAIKKGDTKSAEKALSISTRKGLIYNAVDLGKVQQLNRKVTEK